MNQHFKPLFINFIFPGLGFFYIRKFIIFVFFLIPGTVSIICFFLGINIYSSYFYHSLSYYMLMFLYISSTMLIYVYTNNLDLENTKIWKSLYFNILLPGFGFIIIKYKRKINIIVLMVNSVFLFKYLYLDIIKDTGLIIIMSLVYLIFHYLVLYVNLKIINKQDEKYDVNKIKIFLFIVVLFKFCYFDVFFNENGIRGSLYFFKTTHYFSTSVLDSFVQDPLGFETKKILVNRLAQITKNDIILLSDNNKSPLLVKYIEQDDKYIYASLDLKYNSNDKKLKYKMAKFHKNRHDIIGKVSL